MNKSLILLEQALLEGNTDKASHYLQEIDRHTANKKMVQAGEQFGFETIEIHGDVYTHMGMLSKIFGYSNVSGLWKLVAKYQLHYLKIGWFLPEGKTRARKTFNLSPKDSMATFIGWDTILVAGMHGQNEEARKIKLYLLKMETVGRVALGSEDNIKAELAAKNYELKQIDTLIKIDRMNEGPLKNITIERAEQSIGIKLPKSEQGDLYK